ncbi:lipase family protein [Gordonia sp. (in: high G+C Gram-positive bacteria)]|uniref:lipase family protein n=1 Tax=Gordonia sp. (in: high G+C Gram-positive bacteria) TaxID=84139 RepID=UPI0039E2219A
MQKQRIRPSRRVRRAATATVAAGALVAGLAVGTSTVGAADFYTPPAQVGPAASEPGVLVRTQPIPLMAPLPGRATRIMYMTAYTDDKPVAATGTVIEPLARWGGRGPRPTVVLGPGTSGQGDQCAPSKLMGVPFALDVAKPSLALNFSLPEMLVLLNNGVRVAVVDYVGMGTPGVPTFLNRAEQGHAMLDAARAALKLRDAPGDAPIAFSGYGQGGAAAAAAAELAHDYAPELNVRASHAGAPMADVISVVNKVDGTHDAGTIGYLLNGLTVRYPKVKPILDRELSPAGKAVLAGVAGQCITDTGLTYGFQRSTAWTRTGESLGQLIARTPELRKTLDDQRIGKGKPSAPVLLEASPADDLVPYATVRRLFDDWRGKGASVQLSDTGLPPLLPGTGLAHAVAKSPNVLPATSYLITALTD